MLKLFSLLLAFLFTAVEANLEEAVENFFDRRCSRDGDENAVYELTHAISCLPKCIQDAVPTTGKNETQIYQRICSVLPTVIYDCVEEFLDKLEPCLEDEEDYLSDFVLGSLNISVELQCQDDGKLFYEQRSNLKNANCSITSENSIGRAVLDKCVPTLKVVEAFTQPNFVLKEVDLCSDIKTIKNCFLDVLKENCKKDTYTEYVENIFKPAFTWCAQHESRHIKLDEN